MSTISVNKKGSLVGTSVTTQASARDQASATSISDSGDVNGAIQYFASPGRGGGTYRYIRAFFQFDSSSITGTVSAATLNVAGTGTAGAHDKHVIVIASDAFGGTDDDLAQSDFNNVDFSTAYSSEFTSWDTGGNNAITLNAAARSAIQSNNSFICALVNHDSDYQDTDIFSGGSGSESTGINWDGTCTLVVTVASGYGNKVNSVASANIGKVDGVATANIEKIIGV
tara:strand:- start:43 stop:723 length:681 start_codon:yes stop_codon:yes gene_type:complete